MVKQKQEDTTYMIQLKERGQRKSTINYCQLKKHCRQRFHLQCRTDTRDDGEDGDVEQLARRGAVDEG